jgi:pre-60S factor REI1
MGSAKHKAKLAYAGSRSVNDDASSVMSSTFSLGEPAVANDDDDGVNSVANGIKNAGLKDTSSVAGPSKAATGDGEGSVQTASSVTAADDEIPHETALKRCLFCNYESPSMELSVNHMEKIHGMFVPERPYLVNLEGLVSSLHEKIYEYHECLYCGKLKPTVFGLQTHMRDKGHCKIPFGTEDEQLEIGEFYDFTSTYSDVEDESDDENELPGKKKSGGAKLGARRKAKVADGEGDEDMEEGDGWETDSSASSLDSADLTAVPLDDRQHQYEKLHEHPHHAHTDPRPHHNKDGWHSHAHKHNHAAFYTDYELHLPSGRTAGHRSLNKYFKQNMNGRSPAERQEQEQLRIEAGSSDSDEVMEDGQVARQNGGRGRAVVSRANGGLGMVGVSDEKRREVKLEEKRARKVEQREQRKFQWGNNKQGNFQKHFRVSSFLSVIAYIVTNRFLGSFVAVIDDTKRGCSFFIWRSC